MEKYYTHGTRWNHEEYAYILKQYLAREKNWRSEMEEWLGNDEVVSQRGKEYAVYISNAILGDGTMFDFNENVQNFSLINNFPEDCCIEVPVLASSFP